MKTPIFLTVERDDVYIERLIRAVEKFWSLLLELRAASIHGVCLLHVSESTDCDSHGNG
jgi:hypothetical protein